jgi:hypothetical protein
MSFEPKLSDGIFFPATSGFDLRIFLFSSLEIKGMT